MRQLAVVAVVLALARIAGADNKDLARPHVVAADTDFKLGKFQEALDEYTKAYELYPAPALLFNLAQCHRNLKNWDKAIFFFQGYLREKPDAPNRDLVEQAIKEMQANLDQQHADDAKRQAEAARAADEQRKLQLEDEQRRAAEAERLRLVEAERAAAAQRAQDEQLRRARQPQEHGAGLTTKWWFWTAVGGVALAAGATTYYFASSTTVQPSGSLGGLDRR